MEKPLRGRSLISLRGLLQAAYRFVGDLLPARMHATLGYVRVHGRFPNLRAPATFTEKILWRKLFERDGRLPDLVDKIRSKEIVAARFGEELVIPTLAIYEQPEDMDFGVPPLSQPPYVIKANHGWAMNLLVQDLDAAQSADDIRQTLRGWLATDHSRRMREWAYSQIRRRILVEPYLGPVDDYKFHVFHGRAFACELIANRFRKHRQEAIFDRNWQTIDANYGYPLYAGALPSKSVRERMIELAEAIGSEFSYVRVDLYLLGSTVKFGELTFYPGGGEEKLRPSAWDRSFGEQWRLRQDGLSGAAEAPHRRS